MKGKTIAVGGDGRYFNKQAAQTILKLAAGAGIKKVGILLAMFQKQHWQRIHRPSLHQRSFVQVLVGKDAIMATPAMSALIRRRKLYGEY